MFILGEKEPDILKGKVRKVINTLAKNKAPGVDGIIAEMIMAAEEVGVDMMHHISNGVRSEGTWPEERTTKSVFITLYTRKKVPR